MRGPVIKTCEACGVAFSCGGYQCWCGKVGITEAQMDWIAERYKDCLCPACLGKVVAGELGPHPMSQREPAT
ncbi:MAG: cysteine-rich CWC family protein [Nitrospira sp.]|nr:MAG: hypothetical protein E8D44_14265 [Nitrospira sp.]